MSALTSYFCLFSFSLRSNFSASSCIIHCQSSLAFSLREPIRSFVRGHFGSNCDEIMLSGDLLQFIFRQVIDVEWLPPLRQDLPLLLSLRLFLRPLAALALFDSLLLGTAAVVLYFTMHRNLFIQTFCWIPPYWCVMLVSAFFFLASSSCFFLCSSCSLLSFSS